VGAIREGIVSNICDAIGDCITRGHIAAWVLDKLGVVVVKQDSIYSGIKQVDGVHIERAQAKASGER
jgi:hypothetical protein